MTQRTQEKATLPFRKQLVLPAEHGSWAWLLVPFGVGTAVAGTFTLPTLLVLVGGLAAFLTRQPATVWLRARQGRGRRTDGPPAARWALAFTAVALLCGAALLLLGHTALLWLALPFGLLLGFYLATALSRSLRTRTLWMELAGAAGLALMAPAAMIAAQNGLAPQVWFVWGLMALQNGLGVFYVRLRIADTHRRQTNRWLVVSSHALGATAVVAAAAFSLIPWLTVVPFTGFLLRALWAFPQPRPLQNVKRFGFAEVAVEIASGALVVAGYWFG